MIEIIKKRSHIFELKNKTGICLLAIAAIITISSISSATQVPKIDLRTLIEHTSFAAMVHVTSVDKHAYDNGPLTRVTMIVERNIFGEAPSEELSFLFAGGFLPDGRLVELAESPVFKKDKKYLVFIRSGPWRFTPITNWWHSYFEIKKNYDQDILIDQYGRVVNDLDQNGFILDKQFLPHKRYSKNKSINNIITKIQEKNIALRDSSAINLEISNRKIEYRPMLPTRSSSILIR